jgi:glycosyltransferase involved in cell wall biosynthesis
MLDISVIILTYNEELHIRRCIENVKVISRDIFVVDSFSTDRTIEIAKSLNAHIYQNKWENNYAKQFNWALDNLPIKSKWILRLDADECLTPELIEELIKRLPNVSHDTSGILLKRRYYFLGKWVKHGLYPVKLLRIFIYGKGRCELRWMDEHIQLFNGKTVEFKYDFIDENLNNIGWWVNKHNNYAIREAVDLLDIEYGIFGYSKNDFEKKIGIQAEEKRKKKHLYMRLPLFIRAFFYFFYRYLIKLGFTDGTIGFIFHFLQGLWYRTLVDCKLFEIKKNCGNDLSKIGDYLLVNYNININHKLDDKTEN